MDDLRIRINCAVFECLTLQREIYWLSVTLISPSRRQ